MTPDLCHATARRNLAALANGSFPAIDALETVYTITHRPDRYDRQWVVLTDGQVEHDYYDTLAEAREAYPEARVDPHSQP